MEDLRVSSYMIPVKLESKKDKYMLIHGYTGAMDIVDKNVVLELNAGNIDIFSKDTLIILRKRGYITERTKDEEVEYVERIAHALHKRDEILCKISHGLLHIIAISDALIVLRKERIRIHCTV